MIRYTAGWHIFKKQFHYNKDWNFNSWANTLGASQVFKKQFHYNKDWNCDNVVKKPPILWL